MINARDYDEKRDHIRMKLDTPIRVKLDTGSYIEGTCLDLSATGMQFELDRAIDTGECVETYIQSGVSSLPGLFGKATVVRTMRIDADRFLHGVKLEGMH